MRRMLEEGLTGLVDVTQQPDGECQGQECSEGQWQLEVFIVPAYLIYCCQKLFEVAYDIQNKQSLNG